MDGLMEILVSPDNVIVKHDSHSLYCSKTDGTLHIPDNPVEAPADNVTCLGAAFGVVGSLHLESSTFLLLISKRTSIGLHPLTRAEIWRIDQVSAINVTSAGLDAMGQPNGPMNPNLAPCPLHSEISGPESTKPVPGGGPGGFIQKGQKKMIKSTVDGFRFMSGQIVGGLRKTSATTGPGMTTAAPQDSVPAELSASDQDLRTETDDGHLTVETQPGQPDPPAKSPGGRPNSRSSSPSGGGRLGGGGALSSVMTRSANASASNLQQLDPTDRMLDEVLRIFNESAGFYYCDSKDRYRLTRSIQDSLEANKVFGQSKTETDSNEPENVLSEEQQQPTQIAFNKRFFWNCSLLKDLMLVGGDANESDIIVPTSPAAGHWLVPIIQGYVEVTAMSIPLDEASGYVTSNPAKRQITTKASTAAEDDEDYVMPETVEVIVALISRRSVFRAGTRYIKRGINDRGHVANFVETEQVIRVAGHVLSFVQIRGSVPVYWSQPGYKYKPPPRLHRSKEDNAAAFGKHFEDQLAAYGSETIVNLVEQGGREGVLAEAFLEQVLDFNNEKLSYVAFDFHHHCRGMRFENVAILVEKLTDMIKRMRFMWVDKNKVGTCSI